MSRAGEEGGAPSAWTPELTQDGSWTLRHRGLDEACHSQVGAWTESWQRYAVPCRLATRARLGEPRLRILDVGTGLGWNLAAALAAVQGTKTSLDVISLELDPSVVRRGIELCHRLDQEPSSVADDVKGIASAAWRSAVLSLEGALQRPGSAHAAGSDFGSEGRLRLLLGDARLSLAGLPEETVFDAVFLDPFSPARAPELWSLEFLGQVAAHMAPGAWLSTYSAAVAVRRNLLLAGLRVGVGPRVGAKREGTLASPDRDPPPLPPRLAAKLERQVAHFLASQEESVVLGEVRRAIADVGKPQRGGESKPS